MKLRTLLIAVLIVFISTNIFAQGPEPLKKFKQLEAYICLGTHNQYNIQVGISDFRKLAPNSAFLNRDLTNYKRQPIYNPTSNYPSYGLLIGFAIANDEKSAYKENIKLRAGINYFKGETFTGSVSFSENRRCDTLISNQTGDRVFVDSTYHSSYNLTYVSDQIRLDLSLLHIFNPGARFTFYAGVGITAGVGMNATSIIHNTEIEYLRLRFPGNNNYNHFYTPGTFIKEENSNKLNFGVGAYIPFGVDYRLGKGDHFLSKINVFLELRPGINHITAPELRSVATAALQNMFGLRVLME